MKVSSTYTAVMVYPRWSPDWRTTVEALSDMANLHLAVFVDKNIFTKHLLVFEVMGHPDDIHWFMQKVHSEDRKHKFRLYESWSDHD